MATLRSPKSTARRGSTFVYPARQGARATRAYRLRLLENTKLQSSMSCLGRSFIFTDLRISQMSMPCWLADLMMQFLTYFWRFRQCQLNFMPFASALHAAVAFSRAILSALDNFAACAGVGVNAALLPSTAAVMPAIKVVAKRDMIPSLERYAHFICLVAFEIGADSQRGGRC